MTTDTTHPKGPSPVRHILCPIDFSPFSRRAMERAVVLARACKADITALFVFPLDPLPREGRAYLPPAVAPDDGARAAVAADLEPYLRPARQAGIPVRTVTRAGDPAKEILEQARDIPVPADLIVMGSHGRSGFERWVLGSVADEVVRTAPCPVLTVSLQNDAPGAATDPVDRILCAVDLSVASDATLEYAFALAQATGAELTLVHVIEGMTDESARAANSFAHDRLYQAAQRASMPRGVRHKVVAGKPYREILRLAEEQSAHLIVIGTHGANPVDRMFFGSTADHVVRAAACPVLTVRGVRADEPAARTLVETAALATHGEGER